MNKICIHCDEEFNLNSSLKKEVGGKINECAHCVEELQTEVAVKYVGLQNGEGKAQAISILAFDSPKDREAFRKAWRNNSGQNKGKSCQLGAHLTAMGGMKFKKVSENIASSNHKGKSE